MRSEIREDKKVILEDASEKQCKWKSKMLGDVLPAFVLLILVIGFILAGGGIFMKLELNHQSNPSDGETRFNTFASSVEYCVMLVTTIGYGNICPNTNAGRIATVLYGIVGIPLFFATMLKIGSIFADLITSFFSLCCKKSTPMETKPQSVDDSACPGNFFAMVLGLLVLFLYILGTTFLIRDSFHFGNPIDNSFITAIYVNFITLSTTGYGDYIPNFGACFYAYLFFGLVLIAMNVSLVKNFLNDICHILKREMRMS